MAVIMDLIICFLILGLTYALTSEGLWGAALMFFNVLFSAMIAFNFYEPVANLIDSTGIPWGFSDTLSMLGLFCISVLLLRMTTETIAPAMVRFPTPIYHLGRLVFGVGGAAVTIAIVILAFHAAPVHKKIFTTVKYDTKPPFTLGLDHQWLGFFQYETGAVFTSLGSGQRDPFGAYGRGAGGTRIPVKVFDPRARWLIDHQDARPYGDDTDKVVTAEPAPDATAAPASAEGAAAAAPPG
jgi:uncharacterized membrane protein required for colicin V production